MKENLWVIGSFCLLSSIFNFTTPLICISSNKNEFKKDHIVAGSKPENIADEKTKENSANANQDEHFVSDESVTPEMFGAIGDGQIHKLNTKYNSLEAAQKDFPGVKDLDITIDGAALQKAVDFISAKNGGEIIAEKKYAINFPIITKNNVTIDGKGKGIIYNDRSRQKYLFAWAFFIGDHHAAGFDVTNQAHGSYKLYDIQGSITAGQQNVQLANPSDVSSFKVGQLILVISSSKRQQLRRAIQPFHTTMCKISRISGSTLYFEYPLDESLEAAQIAANGGYDDFAEMNYEGVYNVNIRNLTIDAGEITNRCYGYNCHIDNIKVVNGVRLIGADALTHCTITNISGTFSWRCIEIKTGSSDLTIRNVNGTYKTISDTDHCRGVISLGEYNRNITIDSFKIDLGNQHVNQPIITLQARKATISNGVIYCKNQEGSFLQFYNERYTTDPKFGCYGNKVINVKFYGSSAMKNILSIGENKDRVNKKNFDANKGAPSDNDGVAPNSNVIENCLFSGGSSSSVASLNDGENNVVKNCIFTNSRLKIANSFAQKNTISDNKEQ